MSIPGILAIALSVFALMVSLDTLRLSRRVRRAAERASAEALALRREKRGEAP